MNHATRFAPEKTSPGYRIPLSNAAESTPVVVKSVLPLALLVVLLAPAAQATLVAPPLLWGEDNGETLTLHWQVEPTAAPEEFTITFTPWNATAEVITLAGDLRTATIDKTNLGYYTITYTEAGQTSTTSNAWGPLPYPHCSPTNLVNPALIPPVFTTCFFPLPV